MTADPVGGVWTYMLELVRGLVTAEVEVIVASLGGPVSPAQRAAFERLGPRATLLADHRRLEWMENCWDDVASSGEWLLALEEEHRPDLIHLNGYAHGAVPFRAPVLITAHSCVFSWWRAVHRCYPPPVWHRYHEAVARGLRSARLVVAPTEAMLSALVAHYGHLPAARVIPNGRAPLPSPGLPREGAILGVGRLWDEAKNLRALADIAPRLGWPVRLAGPTRSPDGAEISLPNVELLGVLPEHSLGAHLDRAAIFAAPARYEPFGLSILEAALAGCALVLGDIPSLRENWDGAALFAAPEKPDALHAALQELISSPSLRRRLSAESRRRASAFTPGRMSDAYLAAYAGLLAAPAAAAAATTATPADLRPQPTSHSSHLVPVLA
jgi:glycosyltransferase involved in cell wall biosynthesis